MGVVAVVALGLAGCDGVSAESVCAQDSVVSIAAKLATFGTDPAENWDRTWNTTAIV